MSEHEEEIPDVREWLLNAAGSSSVAPPWQEALAGLTDKSTALQRMAVYRAVRDSGWLSDDAALFLISAQVETITDAEAGRDFRELDMRIMALENQFGKAEGEPWTDEKAAEEYDELLPQYESAWDKLFIDKLIALAEPEIADLYAADPDEFARRYAAGRQQFQEPVQIRGRGASDDLVRVASFVNVSQADLARSVLEREGIPASLGNANLVSWEWEYSNATGGVSVHVRRGDAPRAHQMLTAKPDKPAETRPPWNCPACGQRITGGWEVCWRCGSSMDGAKEEPAVEPASETRSSGASLAAARQLMRILVAAILALFVLLPLALGHVAIAFVNAGIGGMLLLLMSRLVPSEEPYCEAEIVYAPGAEPLPDVTQTRSSVTRAIVRRAWLAAMFGLCGFPPLGFYALGLLWKLAGRDTRLGLADRWRVGLASVLGVAEAMFCVALVWDILVGILSAR